MTKRSAQTLLSMLAGCAVLFNTADASAQSRFDTEIQSLRSLPFGYKTWCEKGNLILKSRSSAQFRISNAALCVGKPDGHIVCLSQPTPGTSADGTPVPACAQISAPDA